MASALTAQSTKKLNSGYEIPVLGFGVYKTAYDQTERACVEALETGYRHIDTAVGYLNYKPCAAAISTAGVDRRSVFFTTKYFLREKPLGYENVKQSVSDTLRETGLSYIDLFLIHAPYGSPETRKGSWRALVESVEEGNIRSIGVSNYGLHHLEELETHIRELEAERGGKGKGGVVSVGQWEVHPWLCRPEIVKWCRDRGVVVEAFCPIVRGQRFADPGVQALARKYGKTPAQVLVRWSLQRGLVPLVKTVTRARMEENTDVFGFALTEEEVEGLATDEYSPCAWDPTKVVLEDSANLGTGA